MCNANQPRQHRTIEARLSDIEDGLCHVKQLLLRLISQEEDMAASQSAEAQGLADAIASLEAELADVESVDNEVIAELQALPGLLAKIGPATPEQVNAVAAVTSSLASLTAKLKGAGAEAATAEAGAGGGGSQPAAPTKAVYTFDASTGAVEDTRFTASGFETVPVAAVPADPATGTAEVPAKPAEPLLYFSEDTAPGETLGSAVAGYAVYTGDTQQAAPAA